MITHYDTWGYFLYRRLSCGRFCAPLPLVPERDSLDSCKAPNYSQPSNKPRKVLGQKSCTLPKNFVELPSQKSYKLGHPNRTVDTCQKIILRKSVYCILSTSLQLDFKESCYNLRAEYIVFVKQICNKQNFNPAMWHPLSVVFIFTQFSFTICVFISVFFTLFSFAEFWSFDGH